MENNNLISTIQLTSKMKNLTGKRQGKLIFIKPSNKVNGRIFWWAKCDCGNFVEIRSDAKKQQCPDCTKKRVGEKLKNKKALNLTNQKFGKLTALYPLQERKHGCICWHCKCDCGNEVDVETRLLTSGNTKSCGCLKREKNNFVQYRSNLVGRKFGFLTVLEETDKREYEKIIWKCQCDCGKIVYLNTNRLTSGNDTSCGCKKQSLGALNIINLLQQNSIKYKKEYTENSLGGKRFDFAIFNKYNQLIRLIEFDGEQHFKITGGWNNKQNFIKGQQRDKQKNEWAKQHNIPLVRIPYWQRDKITLDMILGDQYLVKA